jgi:hypothetical protein
MCLQNATETQPEKFNLGIGEHLWNEALRTHAMGRDRPAPRDVVSHRDSCDPVKAPAISGNPCIGPPCWKRENSEVDRARRIGVYSDLRAMEIRQQSSLWRLHMRQVLLLLSVLLLGACWAAAQDSSSQNSSSPANPSSSQSSAGSTQTGSASSQNSSASASSGQTGSTNANGQTTVEGCLSGSSGNYTLSDKSGNSYQLTGDTAKLSEHVGHEVKVTGTSSSASANGDGTSTGTTGQASGNSQTLEVSSVKHVSKTCQSGGGMSK